MLVNVNFADSTQAAITMYFGGPQPDDSYPNLGTVDTSDARWVAFYDSIPFANAGLPAPTSN
jgi:hypothetical protein